jgi:leishmanolysin
LLLIWVEIVASHEDHSRFHWHDKGQRSGTPQSHSCIHDKILEQQRRIGVKQYKITPQVYEDEVEVIMEDPHSRRLLSVSSRADAELEKHQPIRIFLNYDAVGHSTDRDCHSLHDVVKVNNL